jgi:predicted transcriptional regulator
MSELSNWRCCTVGIDVSLREAIGIINDSGYKVALVIDEHDTLYGVLTDGDIRRALLGGDFLDSPIKKWINRYPVVTSSSTNFDLILEKMYASKLQQIPIVEKGKVIGLHLWDELSRSVSNKSINHLLIMAGGFGKRLMPLTDACPKPLLKIKNKFSQLPNTSYLNIWLQRLTIKIDPAISYSGKLCEKVIERSTLGVIC